MFTNTSGKQVYYDPETGKYFTGSPGGFGMMNNVNYIDGAPGSAATANQMTPQPYGNVTDLYQRVLGRTPSAEEVNAWNAHFKIDPNAKDPAAITQAQLSEFQQNAKPELLALSQQQGYRPSSMMDQWYQPVYRQQYQNYTQPNYSLYGQANPTFSNMASGYLNQAMSMPYAQSNYPVNMGLAQPYMSSTPSYATPNMGGISNLMGNFGQQAPLANPVDRTRNDMRSNKFSSASNEKFNKALPQGRGGKGMGPR